MGETETRVTKRTESIKDMIRNEKSKNQTEYLHNDNDKLKFQDGSLHHEKNKEDKSQSSLRNNWDTGGIPFTQNKVDLDSEISNSNMSSEEYLNKERSRIELLSNHSKYNHHNNNKVAILDINSKSSTQQS